MIVLNVKHLFGNGYVQNLVVFLLVTQAHPLVCTPVFAGSVFLKKNTRSLSKLQDLTLLQIRFGYVHKMSFLIA